MDGRKWMREEIAEWRSVGLIGDDLAETLLARYPAEAAKKGRGAALAGIFGALLTGLGVIALFAANWDWLSRGVRAAVAIAPMAACGAAAVWAGAKRIRAMALWETLGLLWCISTVAATCLVAQTYNLGGSAAGLVFLAAMLTLPAVWATGSAAATALWPLFPVFWACAAREEAPESWLLAAKSLGLAALSLPALAAFLRRNPGEGALIGVQTATGVIYTVGMGCVTLYAAPWQNAVAREYEAEARIGIFCAYSLAVFLAGKKFGLPLWRAVAALVACVCAAFTPWEGMWIYTAAVALSAAAAWYGAAGGRLKWMNCGAATLFWLLAGKFFDSGISFTVKGLAMVSLGVAVLALNLAVARRKRRGKGK